MLENNSFGLKIALVGPCSAGKSTLRQMLKAAGYSNVRNPAQEHSYVPDMWRKITQPDVLIYLDVDYAEALARRPNSDGGERRVVEQKARLKHARQHCDFYINTNQLTSSQVAAKVLEFLATYSPRN